MTSCARCGVKIADDKAKNCYSIGSSNDHYYLCNKCNLQYIALKAGEKTGKISTELAQTIANDFMDHCFNAGVSWYRAKMNFNDKEAKEIKDGMDHMRKSILEWKPISSILKEES